jgi:hypothetical protein
MPLTFSGGVNTTPTFNNTPSVVITPVEITPLPISTLPIKNLIDALIYVESRGKDSAIGDTHLTEPSVGVLQIRPIMVREVNRILKKQGEVYRFKLKDRFNRQKSINMFMVWKDYHHPNDELEKIARNWNGGPRGYRYNRTLQYWVKVQKQLKKYND